jgi:hypothetical protein
VGIRCNLFLHYAFDQWMERKNPRNPWASLPDTDIQTVGDIVFCSTVGEEGLGEFRGAKAIFREGHDLDGFITIEPGLPPRTTYMAMGARRTVLLIRGREDMQTPPLERQARRMLWVGRPI